MNRLYELLALSAIAAAMAGLCRGLASAEPRLIGGLTQELEWITAAAYEQGLRRRIDVSIEIDASEVATGFSRVDCDGLLLIAPLPQTAQGWDHVAPRLDLSGFAVHYLYDGTMHPGVPRLRRLGDRLLAELRPVPASSRPRMVAVAEAGHCDLLARVGGALADFSLGGAAYDGDEVAQWGLRG
jgi:hypothetical protein